MNVVITPAMVGQVVISGLLSGTLYAMVALGLALIFGVMRVINIAHGPMLMLGAYATFFLYSAFGVNPYLTLPVSMAALFVLGMLLERRLVFRVVDAPELSSLLLTFGISIAVVNLAQLAFTSDLRAVEFLTGSFVVGPFAVSKSRIVAFVFAAIITAAVFVFLRNTKLGKAIRATSQRRDVAMVCGINVGRIHLITFGFAAALAAAGGTLIAVIVAIQPEMGQIWTFKSFLVIVLGGAGNYPGALVGGMLLGLIEQLASLFLTTQLSEAVAYVLLVLVLFVRPHEKDDHEQHVGHDFRELGRQKQRRHLLDQPEQYPAEQCAGIVTRPSEDDDEEGLERPDLSHLGLDSDDHGDEGSAGGGQGGRQAEGDEMDALDIDAADHRHLPALRGGPDGLAELRPPQEEEGQPGQGTGEDEGDEPRLRERDRPHHPAAGEVLHRAQVGGEEELGQVDQRDRDAEGEQQRGQLWRVHHPEDERPLEQDTDGEQRQHADRHRQIRVESERAVQEVGGVGP